MSSASSGFVSGMPDSPLVLWCPKPSSKPLRIDRCHVMVNAFNPAASSRDLRHQCPSKPTTTRPVRDGGTVKPYPVCGTHKRVYDDAIQRAEARAVVQAKDAAMESRLEALLGDVPWADKVGLETNRASHTNTGRVILPFEVLEILVEAWRPKAEPTCEVAARGDIVSFIVRDGSRVRYQGAGRVKSIDERGVHVTDGASGRRYVVPVTDVRRKEPRV